jgi:DNA-binding NtrC family response regulator
MQRALHLIVVDDEPAHCETLAMLLQGSGVVVTGCDCAEAALAILRRGDAVDLVLSDVVMPGTDGMQFFELARKLRPQLPIVLVTGRDSAMEWVVKHGSVALLKPYSIASLNGVLREHLGVTI